MHRPPSPLRVAVAIVAGVLFAFAAASPASAAASQFEVKDLGEDLCTEYYSAGEAEWPRIIVVPTVDVVGKATTTKHYDRPCLRVEPRTRHLEFIAFSRDQAVDFHRQPLSNQESSFEYRFTLSAAVTEPIEYVTVAICIDEPDIGLPDRQCTEPVVLFPTR
ncbi:hypothetical protein [Glycomyces sp. NRRL B-16210]|uniref:hypothetical protein n=1 Tax=Glycomyces sp. NRRL B-16210 TaxID=1463821 RepID=UPI0004C2A91C|nr:hypothetical protein [Glycomyces sp. NRRL B-16210]